MRLVLLSDADLPDPDGNFQPAHRLCVELRRRGCYVLHATPREPGKPPLERLKGVPVRRLSVSAPPGGALARAAFAVRGRLALRRWLRELRERPPDLIHAHLSHPAVWLAARAALALGVPWALTVLGGPADRVLARSRRIRRLGKLLRTSSAVAATSERALRRLEPWIRPAAGRAVIPSGADPTEAPLPDTPLVLGIGRIERGRGFAVLLRAFAVVHRSRPDAALVIAGDGPDREQVVRLAQTLNEEARRAIRWEGMPGPERTLDLYRSALAVAFPGSSGGSELSVTAAMAAGRPVVVTRSSGLEHAIDGGNALVVPPGDSGSLAEALLQLIEDRALAERIAHAGRGFVMRNSSFGAIAESHLDLFRSALRAPVAAAR